MALGFLTDTIKEIKTMGFRKVIFIKKTFIL